MSRTSARAVAVQSLYAMELGGELSEELVQEISEPTDGLTEDDRLYLNNVIDGVEAEREQLEKEIEAFSIDWKVERMSRLDAMILILGAYEILYRDDIPGGATVNECVELAKRYSGPEAGSFINGVLGNLLRAKGQATT